MWMFRRGEAAHDGTAPAAAMTTAFSFPCGDATDFFDGAYQQNPEQRQKCAPPNFEQYWWKSAGYYSPAVCPKGYTAGCMRWNLEQGPPVEPTETAVQCVPSGYVCKTDDISVAFSAGRTAPMIQVRWAETDLPNLETHPLYPGVKATGSITRGPDGLFHAARELHYRDASDYSYGYTTPTDLPTSGGGGSSGSGNSGSAPHGSSPDGGDGGGGLSTGAKVGIGVGVAGGVLLIGAVVAITLLMSYRRRRMNKGGPQMQQYNPQQYYQPPPQGQMQGPGGPQYPPAAMQAKSGSPMPPSEMGQSNPNPGRYEMTSTVAGTTTSPSAVGSELYVPSPPPAAGINMASSVPPTSTASPDPQGSVSEMDSAGFRGGVATDATRHELDGTDRPPRELDGASPAPTSPPVPTAAAAGPSFGSPEAEPSAQEISQLQEQHAQLEARKKRLLELEQIEREQESLQQRMSTVRGTPAPDGNQAPTPQ